VSLEPSGKGEDRTGQVDQERILCKNRMIWMNLANGGK